MELQKILPLKSLTQITLILVSLAGLSGCNDTDYLDVNAADRPPLSANISFVNARPINTGLNFWTFTDKITSTPITTNQASAYFPTVFGNVQINFTEGTNTSYKASYQFGNSATFSATGRPNGPIANYYHTVVAARTSNNKADSLILFYDDLKSPESGKAKLRFINLSPGSGIIHVLNGTTPLFSNVGYGRAANSSLAGESLNVWSLGPFQSVTPGQYDLNFTDAANGNTTGSTSSVTLEAGKIYTLFTNGIATSTSPFGVKVLEHPTR